TSSLLIPRTEGERHSEPHIDVSVGDYEGRTDCRKPANFAVALYCGIGSSSLKALVKAFERLHMVRAWNSSCTGCNAVCIVTRSLPPACRASRSFGGLFGRHKSGCL